jgi:hypothetical protein
MTAKWLTFLVPLAFLSCSMQENKVPLPKIDSALKQELTSYLQTHRATPEDYIIGKFQDHDVVFVGEYHRIRENVELIQRLIPLAYRHGVFALCTEFARREDQPMIDSLLRGAAYDESLARQIMFNEMVFWGYQEYVDIFRVAWQLNHDLPPGARRFQVWALNDSPDWSLVKTEADRDNPEIMKKVWRGGGEEFYAKVILDSVVAKGDKALVYSGIHHAFTEYKQPIYDGNTKRFVRFEDQRMGNYVYRAIGKRAITVYLHAPWVSAAGYESPNTYPVDGVIDALMAGLGTSAYPVAFDTKGTPFGKLTANSSIYHHGYDHFTLEQFADGYVFQKPISQYRGVTPIKDFIGADNILQARLQSPNPKMREVSIEEYNHLIAQDADVPRHFSNFH